MAIGGDGASARQLSAVFHLGATGSLTDGQLLERFATRSVEGSELAFAALVERHGALVLRVCRSVLRDEHAAHDAFQATFLVLVARARSLRVAESLAPWLHAVAYRAALNARASAARRRKHEARKARDDAGSVAEDPGEAREVGLVLHEEIEALPERYRAPIVLCDLQGRSHDEAARHLGWPVGTVKSRQARGRDRLRARLVRRGVAPAIGLGAIAAAAAAAGAEAGAAISPALTRSTAALAARITAQGLGAAPVPVASLAKEVLMSLSIGKLKWAGLALLLGVAAAASGAWAIGPRAPGGAIGQRPAPRALRAALARADAPRDGMGKIYFGAEPEGLTAVDPRTGEATSILIRCKNRPKVSPDGRRVAFEWDNAIWVRELDRLDEPRKLLDLEGGPLHFASIVWSADGSKLLLSLGHREEARARPRFRTVRINADGSGREDLKGIPIDHDVQDWSVDDRLVTASTLNAKIGWDLYAMKLDGSDRRQITEGGNPFYARIAPDGKRLLYADGTTEERRGIWVARLDGTDRRLVLPVAGSQVWSACWSPDGKRIAVLINDNPKDGAPRKDRLVLQEVDGPGRTEFPLPDLKMADMPDWR